MYSQFMMHGQKNIKLWALTLTLTVVALAVVVMTVVVLTVVLKNRVSKSGRMLSGNAAGISRDFKKNIFDSLETPVAGFCDKGLSVCCSIKC